MANTNIEKIDGIIAVLDCALLMLNTIDLKGLDATNGMAISSAIEGLQFRKEDLKLVLDDLKVIEGREPWQNSDT